MANNSQALSSRLTQALEEYQLSSKGPRQVERFFQQTEAYLYRFVASFVSRSRHHHADDAEDFVQMARIKILELMEKDKLHPGTVKASLNNLLHTAVYSDKHAKYSTSVPPDTVVEMIDAESYHESAYAAEANATEARLELSFISKTHPAEVAAMKVALDRDVRSAPSRVRDSLNGSLDDVAARYGS